MTNKLKYLYMIILSVVLLVLAGCEGKQPIPSCEPTYLPQKCKHHEVKDRELEDENVTSRTTYLRAVIDNDGILRSWLYDLKAALAECD
jgi:hypothetical protein